MKSNPQHFSGAVRPEQQGTVNLPGQEATRLALPLPPLKSLERLAPVEDQLRMPVGHHALGRGSIAILLENPKAIDDGPKLELRLDLTIAKHLSIIARRTGWSRGLSFRYYKTYRHIFLSILSVF